MALGATAQRAWQALRALLTPSVVTLGALQRMFEGPTSSTAAGASVTEISALNYSAVWGAVQVIAGDLATLPLQLFQRLGEDGKRPMVQHPVYYLLHDRPNPMMTSSSLRLTVQASVLLWGNGFLEIDRDANGGVLALWPRAPWLVSPEDSLYDETLSNEARYYRYTDGAGRPRRIRAADMIHIPGMGGDGIFGYSVIRKARESIGLGLEAEKYGAQFFGNATVASGVYTHPGRLSREGREALRADLEEFRLRRLGTILLEEGTTWTQTSIPPDDAQFLDTRLFQIQELCRWFNLPPQKLKDLSHATYTNAEQMQLDYLQSCLLQWIVRWEQELNAKVIARAERRQQFVKFNLNGIQRGDFKTRMDGYAIGKQWGVFSTNDIRRLEDLDPVEGGDMYLMPVNMFPVSEVDKLVSAQSGGTLLGKGPGGPGGNPDREPGGARADDIEGEVVWRALPLPEPPRPERNHGAVLAAHRALVEEAVRRLGRIEAGRARKAARSAEEFSAWVAEFYPGHLEAMVGALRPVVHAHLAAVGNAGDPEETTRAVVGPLLTEVRGVWQRLLAAAPAELGEAVEKILRQWETERPAQLAARLLGEGAASAHAA